MVEAKGRLTAKKREKTGRGLRRKGERKNEIEKGGESREKSGESLWAKKNSGEIAEKRRKRTAGGKAKNLKREEGFGWEKLEWKK